MPNYNHDHILPDGTEMEPTPHKTFAASTGHIKVYLDDLRPCPEGWIPAKNVNEAIIIIHNHYGTFDVSLDHDLGDGNKDGTHLIKWFVDQRRYPENALIHSANPVGRKNLTFDLENMYRNV